MSTWLAGLGALSRNVGEGIIQGRELRSREQERQLANQLRQLQIKLATLKATQPEPYGIIQTPGGGSAFVTFDPRTGKPSLTPLTSGISAEDAKKSIASIRDRIPEELRPLMDFYSSILDIPGQDPATVLSGATKSLGSAIERSATLSEQDKRELRREVFQRQLESQREAFRYTLENMHEKLQWARSNIQDRLQQARAANTALTAGVGSLRQQYAQAEADARKAEANALAAQRPSAAPGTIARWFGAAAPDVPGLNRQAAEARVRANNLALAINAIERNRVGIVRGTADPDQVMDAAQQVAVDPLPWGQGQELPPQYKILFDEAAGGDKDAEAKLITSHGWRF